MKTIIDGHLDLSWNALSWDRDITLELDRLNQCERGMDDHPARWCHDDIARDAARPHCSLPGNPLVRAKSGSRTHGGTSRLGLDFANQEIASATVRGQLAYYHLLERRGLLRMIRTVADLDTHWTNWESDSASAPIGYILAMEGADPIVDVAHAATWWELGLRSVNLAHYGKSRYAVGTGNDGPLTPDGIDLLKEFAALGMILDATHLSDTSFSEALDRFSGPVLASHNNCRALVPHQRQFSDEQIRRLIDRGAVIGVALDAWMLAPGWIKGETSREVVGIESVANHIDHICELAGNAHHAAIGSDLDGGFGTEQCPAGLDRISDLQKLDTILTSRGYSSTVVNDIFHGNWLSFFRQHLPR